MISNRTRCRHEFVANDRVCLLHSGHTAEVQAVFQDGKSKNKVNTVVVRKYASEEKLYNPRFDLGFEQVDLIARKQRRR